MPDTPAFSWLMFDVDNTLLDFTSAARNALEQTFTDHNHPLDDAILQAYQRINHDVWTAFERGQMTAEQLRVERFTRLFDLLDIFPTTPPQFSTDFLQNLVHKSEAYAGAIPLLEQLRSQYKLSVITNGLKEVQRPRLRKLNMIDLFDSIIVSDEIGVAKPHKDFFTYAYQTIPQPPPKQYTLVIGDSLASDIAGGNAFGCPTCWISHGRPNNTDIQPDYVIDNVMELPEILGR